MSRPSLTRIIVLLVAFVIGASIAIGVTADEPSILKRVAIGVCSGLACVALVSVRMVVRGFMRAAARELIGATAASGHERKAASQGLQQVAADVPPPLPPPPGTLTIEQLIALNDEMAALVRAGVPLEQGLREVGDDLPGRLGQLSTWMAERLERGESLEHVLQEAPGAFPLPYRAVVAAGMRSGKLTSALEGISATARRTAHIRRVMILGIIYPLAVLVVATVVFAFISRRFTDRGEAGDQLALVDLYRLFDIEKTPGWLEFYENALTVGPRVAPYMWLAIAVVLVVWLYRSSRATSYHKVAVRGLPSVSKLVHYTRMSTFADVLALMVEQQVSMAEAITLSARASGDKLLVDAGGKLADQIRSGDVRGELPRGFPPMLGWLLGTGQQPQQIIRALRETAGTYRARARRAGTWLTVYFPIILSAGVGGAVTLLYVLTVLAPFYHLLFVLGEAP